MNQVWIEPGETGGHFRAEEMRPEQLRVDPGVKAPVAAAIEQATQPGEAASALDFDAMETEYLETGGLSEETFALLEQAGVPRRIVEQYVAGQLAMGETLKREVYEIAGGEARFEAMRAWAETGLSAEQRAAYQEAVEKGPEEVKWAVQALAASYARAVGEDPAREPRLVEGEAKPSAGGLFRSAAEVAEAIRDRRYKKDPAYRADIADRLARSKVF